MGMCAFFNLSVDESSDVCCGGGSEGFEVVSAFEDGDD
ncbi:hypothetical protein QOZ94_004268, partial [Xanthobacter agilis]|nr:hypothetical protein [Xanthobacter agilis]